MELLVATLPPVKNVYTKKCCTTPTRSTLLWEQCTHRVHGRPEPRLFATASAAIYTDVKNDAEKEACEDLRLNPKPNPDPKPHQSTTMAR